MHAFPFGIKIRSEFPDKQACHDDEHIVHRHWVMYAVKGLTVE